MFGGVDVALDLRERDRSFRKPAVGMEHGIVRIFPALIGEPLLGRAVILDEAVAIAISRAVDPLQRGFERRPQFPQGREVSGALGIHSGEQHE